MILHPLRLCLILASLGLSACAGGTPNAQPPCTLPTIPVATFTGPSQGQMPRAPSPTLVMQAVDFTNNEPSAVTVAFSAAKGGPSGCRTRVVAPGQTIRFSTDDSVPVVVTRDQQRRCLYVGPIVPSGLGGFQPDQSQLVHASQSEPC